MPRRLEGVLVPVTTPFDDSDALARPAFEANLRAHLAAGLHGIVIAGSTGEAALLEEGERARLVEWARAVVPAERWLLAGVGAESTRATLRLAREAAERGADAVLVVPPHYYGAAMTAQALATHYRRIADESRAPVVLYNIPKHTHFILAPALVAELAMHPNIVGIKDSAGDAALFASYLNVESERFAVFTGSGTLFGRALEMGARGGIIAVGLFAPALALAVYEAVQRGDLEAARAAQDRLTPLAGKIVGELGVPGIRAALDAIGLHGGAPRPPLLPLAPAVASQVAQLLAPAEARRVIVDSARALARRHLAAIAAAPRPAGGDAEREARGYCAAQLSAHGFSVREEPFDYSAAPGRWATPLGGMIALVTLLAAAWLGVGAWPIGALVVLVVMLVALAAGGTWIARRGVLALPLARARATNLVATRGNAADGAPAVWMVAHLDSKSQPVPMLARAGGITLVALAWLAGIAIALVQLVRGAPLDAWWWTIGVVGALAALQVAATTVGGRSPGAVDNASGAATVLLAAAALAELSPASCVGVLITSAEELGLAGARAWLAAAHGRGTAPAPVLNCDGIDDEGTMTIMYSWHGAEPAIGALAAEATAQAMPMRVRRILPGILTDSVAFADAGWPAVTVSRGDARTLLRIHRPADSLAALTGEGVARTAPVLARAAASLAGLTIREA